MECQTTKLQALKSYPTYQFHAFTASEKLSTDSVFKICVFETLRWLRLRLNSYDLIPNELKVPDPENYAAFSEDKLCSFNINAGANIDCTYIQNKHIWSIRITEPDTGENIGTATERLPVNGRTFQTELSFVRHSSNVEVGVRTTCSEPIDCNAPCSVFRPAVVKALAENPDVGFEKEGFHINGKPLIIKTQSDLHNLMRLFKASDFDMPIAIIADSEQIQPQFEAYPLPDTGVLNPVRFLNMKYIKNIKADVSKVEIKNSAEKTLLQIKQNKSVLTPQSKTRAAEKQPVIDYEWLASKTMGFAVICFVSEKCFDHFSNKLGIKIKANDIIIYVHGTEIERSCYETNTLKSTENQIRTQLRDLLKRSSFSYGNILFYSDARLADLREKNHENISLEDKLALYIQENKELKLRNQELTQQNTDLQLSIENTRYLHKQIKLLTEEKDELIQLCSQNESQYLQKENAYHKAADLVEFYRTKAKDSAYFPTDKNSVCECANSNFSDNIIIFQRA